MNKKEVLKKLKELNLDKNEYIVISGASLVLHDVIDVANDIDLSCSKKYYDKINWPTKLGHMGREIKYFDCFEISDNLYDNKNIDIIDGYKTMNLEKCLEVKRILNRPKDKKVINKLDLLLGKDDNYRYERKLINNNIKLIAGVDEVGRGPLVGPVVAAACILPPNYHLEGLTDSKKLSEKKRNEYFEIIKRDAISYGIGIVDAKTIDEVNIYEASKMAMISAINNLSVKPQHLLIDAMKLNIDIEQTSIIKGDFLSESIAAASVLAKVTRDEMMYELDKKYPMYGFKNHKGYPTKEHIDNVKKYGVLDNYRFTYKPICGLIYKDEDEGVGQNEITN